MRNVEEKRIVFVTFDELHRAIRDAPGEVVGVRVCLNDLFTVEKGQGRELEMILTRVEGVDIVAVRNSKKLVEPLAGREELRLITQMPFAAMVISAGFNPLESPAKTTMKFDPVAILTRFG